MNIENHTILVQKRKNTNELFVTKKSIIETEPPMNKEYLTSFTINHPEVLRRFKENNKENIKSLNGDLFNIINVNEICQILIDSLKVTYSFFLLFINVLITSFLPYKVTLLPI